MSIKNTLKTLAVCAALFTSAFSAEDADKAAKKANAADIKKYAQEARDSSLSLITAPKAEVGNVTAWSKHASFNFEIISSQPTFNENGKYFEAVLGVTVSSIATLELAKTGNVIEVMSINAPEPYDIGTGGFTQSELVVDIYTQKRKYGRHKIIDYKASSKGSVNEAMNGWGTNLAEKLTVNSTNYGARVAITSSKADKVAGYDSFLGMVFQRAVLRKESDGVKLALQFLAARTSTERMQISQMSANNRAARNLKAVHTTMKNNHKANMDRLDTLETNLQKNINAHTTKEANKTRTHIDNNNAVLSETIFSRGNAPASDGRSLRKMPTK